MHILFENWGKKQKVSCLLSIFVGTMIVRESQEVVETSVRFMNHTFHDHPQVAIAAQDLYQRILTMVDDPAVARKTAVFPTPHQTDLTAAADGSLPTSTSGTTAPTAFASLREPAEGSDVGSVAMPANLFASWTSRALVSWPILQKLQRMASTAQPSHVTTIASPSADALQHSPFFAFLPLYPQQPAPDRMALSDEKMPPFPILRGLLEGIAK